ncbi:MAG: hypothetical protein PHG63_03530, partial [Candidatus Dojkabacteria bacterium]|nr:hypothetical protein [Candidatus Dojkabacteria bacterium]
SINPVSRGLNVFEDERIDEIVENSGEGTWAVFGDNAYANLLKAYGADVFNGVKIVPDLESMHILDPGLNYVEIYNRYAHISLQTPPSDHEAELFTLNFPDSYTITIDPCDERLNNLGIDYILTTEKSPRFLECATLLTVLDSPIAEVEVYELTR